jgi:predicted DNA-binding transcriptional regulator AlpA
MTLKTHHPSSAERPDELVPDPQVAREFNVTPMTIWRWDHDAGLGFPPPIKIRTRNFRSRRALEAFKECLMRGALEARTGKVA